MTTKSVSVRVFETLFGSAELSNIHPKHPVDTRENILSPLVGRTWGDLLEITRDSQNNSRPEIKALKILMKDFDVTGHLVFPDFLGALNGMTGDEIRRISKDHGLAPPQSGPPPKAKKKVGRKPLMPLMPLMMMFILCGATALIARSLCPACDTCAKPECPACTKPPECQCVKCPACAKCPQCAKPPECPMPHTGAGAKPQVKPSTDNSTLQTCIRILLAREEGDDSKALLVDVKKSSERQIAKAAMVIIKTIHPDKVSPGLRLICEQATSHITQFIKRTQ